MKKIVFLIIMVLVCVAASLPSKQVSLETRVADLEARVTLLEEWAIRHGGKLE